MGTHPILSHFIVRFVVHVRGEPLPLSKISCLKRNVSINRLGVVRQRISVGVQCDVPLHALFVFVVRVEYDTCEGDTSNIASERQGRNN